MTSPETTREAGDTEARLLSIIGMNYAILVAGGKRIADHSKAAQIIAAEIDALTAERDKAQAEVERLRLPAEAWETQEHYDSLRVAPMADVLAADAAMKVAAARARKAANLKKLVAEQEQAAARARAAKETT